MCNDMLGRDVVGEEWCWERMRVGMRHFMDRGVGRSYGMTSCFGSSDIVIS